MTLLLFSLALIGIASLRNPAIGLAAYYANLLIGISIRYPQLSGLRPMAVIPVFVIAGWYLKRTRINAFTLPFPARHDLMYFGFSFAIMVGNILYRGFRLSFSGLIYLPISLLLFFGLSRMISSIGYLRIIITTLIVVIVALAVEGIFFPSSFTHQDQTYIGLEMPHDLSSSIIDPEQAHERLEKTRFSGVGRFDNANEQALMMNIALPFLLLLIKDHGFKRISLLSGSALLVTTYMTIQTASRAGFLGYLAILMFSFGGKNKGRQLLLTVVLIAMTAPLLSSSYMSDRVGSTSLTNSDMSAQGRIDAWYAAKVMIKSHPLFGVGKGNFIEHYELMAHNSLLLVAAETGLIGAFFWVMLIVLAFKSLNRIENMKLGATDDQRYLMRITTSLKLALIGFLVTSFFGNQCYNAFLIMFMALPHAMEKIALDMSAVAKN